MNMIGSLITIPTVAYKIQPLFPYPFLSLLYLVPSHHFADCSTTIMGTFQISTSLFLLPAFLFCYTFILPYFTSPLRRIPGPFLAKFTNLWRLFNTYDGRPELRHRQLHEQYGPVVRLGPSVVSLNDPKLITTIYNTRGEFLKVRFLA